MLQIGIRAISSTLGPLEIKLGVSDIVMLCIKVCFRVMSEERFNAWTSRDEWSSRSHYSS